MPREDDRAAASPRRLRVPAALAAALVGSSASFVLSSTACDVQTRRGADAAAAVTAMDANDGDAGDAAPDAIADAAIDAEPDAAPDAPLDASVPPDGPPT